MCVFGAAVVSKIEIQEMAETAENMAGVLRGYLILREELTQKSANRNSLHTSR